MQSNYDSGEFTPLKFLQAFLQAFLAGVQAFLQAFQVEVCSVSTSFCLQ